MDRDEAAKLLGRHLERVGREPFDSLSSMVGNPRVTPALGHSGVEYQIEVEAMWDDESNGVLRVLGSIDDATFRGAFSPVTDDFLITRDGPVDI
ncbi:MAG TPA: hypothetical protein VK960_10720 [Acidimicrobiia bacterium]|nr:hypothetical protein [Acidimicrobiia bacterium]